MTESERHLEETRQVEEALRRWGSQPTPVETPGMLSARAERGRATIANALRIARADRRRRRVRRWLGGSLLVAAAALFTTSWALEQITPEPTSSAVQATVSGTARLIRDGAVVALTSTTTILDGDRIEAETEGAVLRLAGITRARLGSASALSVERIDDKQHILSLHEGRAAFDVDPRGHKRVVVQTDDTRVEVTGTAFDVITGSSTGRTWTTVRVHRGSVRVHHGSEVVALRRGDVWTSRPAEAQTVARVPEAEATPTSIEVAPTDAHKVHVRRATPNRTASKAAEVGTLAAENRLFRSALKARNDGNDAECVRRLDRFLAQYPASTLRQEARVERFRALKRMGQHREAARSARQYLADHEDGIARDEARDVALSGSAGNSPETSR